MRVFSRLKRGQRALALVLVALASIWVLWLLMYGRSGLILPTYRGGHMALHADIPAITLPSLHSIKSKEGLPILSLPWEDFSRTSSGTNGRSRSSSSSKLSASAAQPGMAWHDDETSGLYRCPQQQATSTTTSCSKGTWGNAYLQRWAKSKEIPNLCEDNAPSTIHCHDSPLLDPSTKQTGEKKKKPMRFCEFGNAMLNFRKMRSSGDQRSFERGFLAAGCGYSSPENIGINVYNPDIVSGTCDFIFNETVVVYSHTNIERGWTVLKDYWSAFSILQLASAKSREDVKKWSLLNIDSLVRGMNSHYNGDKDDEKRDFFYQYHAMFRRVLRATDFPPKSTACFRKLLWVSRPADMHSLFLTGTASSTNANAAVDVATAATAAASSSSSFFGVRGGGGGGGVSSCTPPLEGSDFFHRWSLYSRRALGVLPATTSSSSSGGGSSSNSGNGGVKGVAATAAAAAAVGGRVRHSTNEAFHVLYDTAGTSDHHTALLGVMAEKHPAWKVTAVDLSQSSLRELVMLYSNVSLVISGKGADALMGAAYMPVGTRNCCGVLELTVGDDDEPSSSSSSSSSLVHSFAGHAQFMGHTHTEAVIPPGVGGWAGWLETKSAFASVLDDIVERMAARVSCIKV